MQTLDIELQRNAVWRRSFQLTDNDDTPLDLTGSTFDMDIRYLPGAKGNPLLNGTIEVVDAAEGKFEVELKGESFDAIGNPKTNLRLVYDLVITQDDIPVPVLTGKILLVPGVSDNEA